MKMTHALSWQLLRAVLSIYFSITVGVTLVQMGIEYLHTRDMIRSELASVERTFYPALATALWEINHEQLAALRQGIVDLPLITSVRIVDAKGGDLLKHDGADPTGTGIEHAFPVSYRFADQDVHLADVTFGAAGSVVWDRLKLGYQMILITAMIKSVVLTFLFVWAFRRRLGVPLGQLAAAVAAVDLDSLGSRRIDLHQPEENELSKLESAFNHMLGTLDGERRAHDARLEELNKSLEAQVVQRTEELAAANRRLEQLASTDPLTGAANRRRFVEQAGVEIRRARRGQTTLSLLMIDLDNFKALNDTWGHAMGDEVLCDFATMTASALRAGDLFARIGGEEFAVLLPDTDLEGAVDVGQRLLEATRIRAVPVTGGVVHYSASLGVATWRPDEETYDAMMSRADAALYRAKQGGRNRLETE